jgi:hypothetical protein
VGVRVIRVHGRLFILLCVVISAISAVKTLNLNAMSNIKKLAAGKINRIIDIDGTICTDLSNEDAHLFPYAEAFEGAVEKINRWAVEGDTIVFFTAREEKHREATEQWLDEHGFYYDYLLMGKPRGGNYKWYDNLDGEFHKVDGNWEKVE